jgi:ABC-type transporter Mla subunit MlaD
VAKVVAPTRPTLDAVTHTLAPVTTPITRALSTPHRAAAPTPSLSDATSSLLAETRTALTPTASSATQFDPRLLLPTLSELLTGAHAIPVPPTTHDHAPVHSHPSSGSTPTLSRVSHADVSGQPRSPSPARPADESLSATPAPASASHGQLAGPGIPAPLPALPPVGPDSVLATGFGSTATSSSGSGSGLSSGYGSAGDIRPDALLLGPAESARTRPVRNTATEPPVSPD